MEKHTVVLLRHGESEWNRDNIFCGWHDSDISPQGSAEASEAAVRLLNHGFSFDVAYTSVLKRAIKSLNIIQDAMDLHWIPVYKSWRLNERMYGALQGFHKSQTASKYGEQQVKIWRRSYDVPPPPVDLTDKYWPGHDARYAMVDKSLIPRTESLKDTEKRLLPYWLDIIVPSIKRGDRVLVVAHGTSLRALVKFLDNISDGDINSLNIPNGVPLVYKLDADLHPVGHYFLADDAEVETAVGKIIDQGKMTFPS